MSIKKLILALTAAIFTLSCSTHESYDVVIIGGGASGTAAAIQSARMGANTLIVEEFEWLGGMLTSAGVSATDGNYRLRGGIWDEFRSGLEQHYGGGDSVLITGWVSNVLFEPSVGNSVLKSMAAAEKNLTVWYKSTPTQITAKQNGGWTAIIDKDGKKLTIDAKVLIDATELGDIAKELGVGYDLGMDSSAVTGETIAPAEANHIIQDLTYVAVLKDYGHDVTIAKPEGYDPSLFSCCCDNPRCITPKEEQRVWAKEMMITYGKLPNNKYMINWPIEGNDYYVDMVDMSADERAEAVRKAKNQTLCFLYFMQTELGFQNLGLADDEFPTEDLMPFIPYHRESRRIHGIVRFTLNHITDPYTQSQKLYRTTIGVGDYPVDQHHTRYSGWEDLPNLYFYSIPSYGLPMGVLLPEKVRGLIVAEKSISVTNVVNGSSRLQPVVLQIGQASGALAALAVKQGCDVSEVAVREVQDAILQSGGYLQPYLDMPSTDPRFRAMQRIGVTGILKGRGMNAGWENQTWFDADANVSVGTLREGMAEVYSTVAKSNDQTLVNCESLAAIVSETTGESIEDIIKICAEKWSALSLADFNATRSLTRIECAVVIDAIVDPFHTVDIDVYGEYKTTSNK